VHVGASVERIVAHAEHVIFPSHDGTGLHLSRALHGLDHQWQ